MSKTELIKVERKEARQRIEKMLAGEDILLTSEEEKILTRWEFADRMLSKKEFTWAEIRQQLVDEFAISRYTAENDITAAQEIFGRIKRISKRYLLHLHLDRMDRDIEKIRKGLFTKPLDDAGEVTQSRTPDEKEILALAKLYDAYTKGLNAIPEDISKTQLPPPVLVFHLPEGTAIQPALSYEAALKMADEYIDYEMMPHASNPNTTNGSAS